MYIVLISLIIIASFLLILAVLAQNPKGGMAANFGASNQVMGVRQTSDFLEKSTWTLAVAIVILSLAASIAMSSHRKGSTRTDNLIEQVTGTGTTETGNIPSTLEDIQLEEQTSTPVDATDNVDETTATDSE